MARGWLDWLFGTGPREILAPITEEVGQRMKQLREEENFQTLLVKWKSDLDITEFPENLEGLKSWRDLTVASVPENLVPRN